MSMSDVDNLRHAEIRGKMLVILAEDYNSTMTSIGTLTRALDLRGYSLSAESLAWQLRYLEDCAYLKLWRTQDVPGYRRDKLTGNARPEDIRFARILPKGIQLIDGDIAEDPKVKF